MTDTSVMNYALTSASAAAASTPASATSTSNTSSMAAAAAFYQQQAAASAALASLDPASSHHHQPLASAAAASAAALANVDTPRYPWMSITGKAAAPHTSVERGCQRGSSSCHCFLTKRSFSRLLAMVLYLFQLSTFLTTTMRRISH